MEKNYYEWLEINENASPEIIEKAYKTLVKKYHPDLQENNKSKYEEIIKKINEAYEILSDETKRANYDISINQNKISNEDFINLKKENLNLKNEINILKSNIMQQNTNVQHEYNQPVNNKTYENNIKSQNVNNFQNNNYHENNNYNDNINNAINKAYYDAYIQDLKNRGYKIRYQKSFKDYMKSLIAIAMVIFIWIILWQIPFVRNYLIDIYNNNSLIKSIVDIFLNLFSW